MTTTDPKSLRFTPGPGGGGGGYNDDPRKEFKIEIPIQPKPQSVEDAADKWFSDTYGPQHISGITLSDKAFKAGASWQAKQINIELENLRSEVRDKSNWVNTCMNTNGELLAKLAELSAVLVRYREALEYYANYGIDFTDKFGNEICKRAVKELSIPLPKGWAGG